MLKLAFSLVLLPVLGCPALAGQKAVTIDALMEAAGRRAGEGPAIWAPNGNEFVVNKSGTLAIYDAPSGKQRDVIQLSKLEGAAATPEQPATFDWTNRRVDENDIQWFADGKRLLVSATGDLFIVDVNKGSFEQLTHTSDVERDPKLSPDNQFVSFRRGPNLFTIALSSKKLTQLTTNGSETLLNGQLDWVYPEELELGTAHWWSPDSHSIAYFQFDVAHEPIFPQVYLLKQHGLLEPERYPKAGDPNAEVRLGIVSPLGGETKWMDLGEPRGNLMARVTWLPSSREVAVEKLPRIQNKLDLLVADIETGRSRILLHEEDPKWINVKDEPYFLGNGDQFIWSSERDGFRHLYLMDKAGNVQKQLTRGTWEVASWQVRPEKSRIFFTSTEASPLERQFYSIALDGGGKQQLSQGAGTHTISVSQSGSFFLDRFSNRTTPPRTTLYREDGTELRVYRQPDTRDADQYNILPTEIVDVKAADGMKLYARLIKPAGFQSGKKYPAVVMVYGGPGIQSIHNVWAGLTWDQVLAHKGFVIWQLDNRGSSGRGHAFESVIYHDMGAHELEDQKTGIQWLVAQGFVDPERIGLYGWSYGGYMTLYTVTNAPTLIRAAIAGAPVTNWHNYDSIYTERYMGLPAQDEQAYKVTSPQTKAAELKAKLLIVHNIEDDNVHFANTMQMADALQKANRQFYMLVFPQKSHGVTGPVRRQLLEETTAFFENNLR